MIDTAKIIERLYSGQDELKHLLLLHSRSVMEKACECARLRGLSDSLDMDFVREAAMLHDIGILRCDAPSILCHGTEPYICHGIEGRKILETEGLPRHALVCERHTGAGLTIADIESQKLPLPRRDMCPVSMEEQIICYADKFFSKSGNPVAEKPLQRVIASLRRHGDATVARFLRLHALFGTPE